MFRRRRRLFRKRAFRKRRLYRTKSARRSTRKIRQLARGVVVRMSENKYFYTSGTGGGEGGNKQYYYQLGAAITQGTGTFQRIGQQLTGKRITIKGYFYLQKQDPSDITNYVNRLRVIVGYYLQEPPNQNPPSFYDIMDPNISSSQTPGNNDMMNSMINREFFKPLKDKTYVLSPTGQYNQSGYRGFQKFGITIPFKKLLNYKANAADPLNDICKFPYLYFFIDQNVTNKVYIYSYITYKISYMDL